MRCFKCEAKADPLFPLMGKVGKVPIQFYVCRECFRKAQEGDQ